MTNIRPNVDEYTRELNVIRYSIDDYAKYLEKNTGKPYDQCRKFAVKAIGPSGKFTGNDPEAFVLERKENGDREKRGISLSKYLRDVQENNLILSPTMATYLPPEKKVSMLSLYMDTRIKDRGKQKSEMKNAEMIKDTATAIFKDNQQKGTKTFINSLSGAECNPSTPVFNKSAHSTLTSTCRTATAYSNANAERFLGGTRHYYCPEVVKINITNIINNSDYTAIKNVMDKYQLHYPSVDETLMMIRRSTDLYFIDGSQIAKIRSYLEKMLPMELAAIVYTGDLYHLAEYNWDLVRDMLDGLTTITDTKVENPEDVLKQIDGDTQALVAVVCAEFMKGNRFSDIKENQPENYSRLASTYLTIKDTLGKYTDLIRTFWMTDNLPPNVAVYPYSLRRVVVAGDTDSTIFTAQYWPMKFNNGILSFDTKSTAIGAAVTYLLSETLSHILIKISTQMGCNKDMRTVLQMKNEYGMPILMQTTMAKHYASLIAVKEGNIFSEPILDLKGVNLRGSATPENIRKIIGEVIVKIIDDITVKGNISLNEYLCKISSAENQIIANMTAGKSDYLKTCEVKRQDNYKNPHSSPYLHYELWNEIFSSKYGFAPEPPYRAVKVSMQTDKPYKLNHWLNVTITDPAIAERAKVFFEKHGKKHIASLLLPVDITSDHGIPKEIVDGSELRKLVSDVCLPLHLIAESTGYYFKNNNHTRLVSDLFKFH